MIQKGNTPLTLIMARLRSQPSFVFFFSSRRPHTRCLSDWSSDVCSSDLPTKAMAFRLFPNRNAMAFGSRRLTTEIGRASCRGKSVDLGGRRIIKKKKKKGAGAKKLRIAFLHDRSWEDFLCEVEYIRYVFEHGGSVFFQAEDGIRDA